MFRKIQISSDDSDDGEKEPIRKKRPKREKHARQSTLSSCTPEQRHNHNIHSSITKIRTQKPKKTARFSLRNQNTQHAQYSTSSVTAPAAETFQSGIMDRCQNSRSEFNMAKKHAESNSNVKNTQQSNSLEYGQSLDASSSTLRLSHLISHLVAKTVKDQSKDPSGSELSETSEASSSELEPDLESDLESNANESEPRCDLSRSSKKRPPSGTLDTDNKRRRDSDESELNASNSPQITDDNDDDDDNMTSILYSFMPNEESQQDAAQEDSALEEEKETSSSQYQNWPINDDCSAKTAPQTQYQAQEMPVTSPNRPFGNDFKQTTCPTKHEQCQSPIHLQQPIYAPLMDPVVMHNPIVADAFTNVYEEFDTIDYSKSSDKLIGNQGTSLKDVAAASTCHDAFEPIYNNEHNNYPCTVDTDRKDPNLTRVNVQEAPKSVTPLILKAPATVPIQSKQDIWVKDDKFGDANNANKSNESKHSTFTRDDVRQCDRKPSNRHRHHSIASTVRSTIKSVESEQSTHPKKSMESMFPSIANSRSLQNDSLPPRPAEPSAAAAEERPVFTQYICIMEKMYKDLRAVKNESQNQSRLCCVAVCSEFQRIENENGLLGYVEHLMREHPCLINEEILNAEEMLRHRLEYHKWEPLIYMHIEEFKNRQVYKIVCKHNQTESKWKQSIEESIVVATKWKALKESPEDDYDKYVFICNRHHPPLELGTKADAVRHHNEVHVSEVFQCTLKRFEDNNIKDELYEIPEHRAYLFKCFYCKTLFASMMSFNEHVCESEGQQDGPHFTAHKLVACHLDNTIETFEQMHHHFIVEHAYDLLEGLNPVDIFHSEKCGMCDYFYTDFNDLKRHYACHAKGEIVTIEFIAAMGMLEFNIDESHFAPVCCPQFKMKGVEETIQRMCQRHFTCNKCKTIKFDMKIINLINCQDQNCKKSQNELFGWLQKLKLVPALFKDMQITLPNGFTAPIANIECPYFEAELQEKLHETIIKIWQTLRSKNRVQMNKFIYFADKFNTKP